MARRNGVAARLSVQRSTWLGSPDLGHDLHLFRRRQCEYEVGGEFQSECPLFTTNLAYNITETGKTSISFEYQNGTNRDTLEKLNQYLVTLNVKY